MHASARYLRQEQGSGQRIAGHQGGSTLSSSSRGDLWKWILHKACCQKENFLLKQDKAGETCIDCFMSSWIRAKKGTTDVGKAVERILESDRSVFALRSVLVSQKSIKDTSGAHRQKISSHSSEILMVAQFCLALELICRAACLGSKGLENLEDDFSIIPFIAETGKCPDIVARLLVRLYPEQIIEKDNNGFLPLHLWALGTKQSDSELSQELLGPLLGACPQSATYQDDKGRIPLHLALAHKKPLFLIEVLWTCAPQSLGIPDPEAELYPFALAAVASRSERRELSRGREKRGPSVKLYEWLDTTRDVEGAEEEASAYLLGSIYNMLRSFPQALQDSLTYSRNDDDS